MTDHDTEPTPRILQRISDAGFADGTAAEPNTDPIPALHDLLGELGLDELIQLRHDPRLPECLRRRLRDGVARSRLRRRRTVIGYSAIALIADACGSCSAVLLPLERAS